MWRLNKKDLLWCGSINPGPSKCGDLDFYPDQTSAIDFGTLSFVNLAVVLLSFTEARSRWQKHPILVSIPLPFVCQLRYILWNTHLIYVMRSPFGGYEILKYHNFDGMGAGDCNTSLVARTVISTTESMETEKITQNNVVKIRRTLSNSPLQFHTYGQFKGVRRNFCKRGPSQRNAL